MPRFDGPGAINSDGRTWVGGWKGQSVYAVCHAQGCKEDRNLRPYQPLRWGITYHFCPAHYDTGTAQIDAEIRAQWTEEEV